MKNKTIDNGETTPPIVPPPIVEDEFVTWIKTIGENEIIGFLFDNAGRKSFIGERFSLEKYYVPELKALVFDEETINCTPYKVIKPIDTIQGVMTVLDEHRDGIKGGRDILG